MTQFTKLKSAGSLRDVASLLAFKSPGLAYILFRKDAPSKYRKFEIPKRQGGFRTICAPSAELKKAQKNLADLLQNCVETINLAKGHDDQISHGFTRKRSIITNAKKHRNQRYVFNIDLKDFFNTINFGRVRGFFIKDKNFALQPEVATILAQIACHENALPQGSPCSPVISNLIGHVLDIHLVKLASRTGCTYSRYADDLTFSTNKKTFPPSIAECVLGSEHNWVPGKELSRLIRKSGFEINEAKTRMQYHDSRQEVTGLVVNKIINVPREYRHTVRAMVHRLFVTGEFDSVHYGEDEHGAVIKTRIAGTMHQLHGRLGFIDSIDLYNKSNVDQEKNAKDESKITSKESLYRRFLLYKEFYVAASPVIICEGKTDNVYLLHAIRSLVADYPLLATRDVKGVIKLNIRIFKFTDTSTGRILGMSSGGGPNLAKFIRLYAKEVKGFKSFGIQKPVIVLVDNDSGSDSVFSVVKSITKNTPTRTEPFIHVANNLYVATTPLKAGQPESEMEDFFDLSAKATLVDGKKFDQRKTTNPETHYGKQIFAHKVVVPHADKIDFNGFRGILDNLEKVIDAHASKYVTDGP